MLLDTILFDVVLGYFPSFVLQWNRHVNRQCFACTFLWPRVDWGSMVVFIVRHTVDALLLF